MKNPLRALLAGLASLSSLGCAVDGPEPSTRSHAQAVGEADVLGFENVGDWTASVGAPVASAAHTQGAASLAITTSGWVRLSSRPLSTLPGPTGELLLDVQVPATAGWGNVQLAFDASSLGLYDAWIGQASLSGLTPGSFHTVSFTLPEPVRAALSGSYSDLVIRISLNAPGSSSPYLLDHLRFGGAEPGEPDCADGSPYTLDVTGEEALPASLVEDMRCTFFTVYPLLVARFNPSAPTTVGMHFVEDDRYPAWAIGSDTFYSIPHMLPHPLGTDVVVHEIMHVVQQGYLGQVPSWFIEGSADYVRDLYGLRNAEFGWSIPSGYTYGQHYRQGYGEAAAFFQWIDATYRQALPPIVDALDDLARAGSYSGGSWVTLTGYDVDALWSQYSGGLAPLPATSGARFFGDSDFEGDSIFLDVGQYDVSDLSARGVPNDWVSSIEVPSGYHVTIFEHGGFQGASATYDADVTFWHGDAWNDRLSSVVITRD